MKGIICYYSGSGNTKLACEYIKGKVRNLDFELCDVAKAGLPDMSKYEIAGFATYTDFGGVPRYFCSFLVSMAPQPGKYAFVLNTYGFMPVKTLKTLQSMAGNKDFIVLCGHSLHTPESYPPMRARNMRFDQSPNKKELKAFDNFIVELDDMAAAIVSGRQPRPHKIGIGLLNSLIPAFGRNKAKNDYGVQKVDPALCVECGTCKRVCPSKAIELSPKPVFDHARCYGCWACYNHCPQKAVYTKKYKGIGHYPEPAPALVGKLSNDREVAS